MGLKMKRNNMIGTVSQDKLITHKQRVAFHEAGHAAGIYLNNKTKRLSSVSFKIIIKEISTETGADVTTYQTSYEDCIARVEGGRLIELAPPFIHSLVRELIECNEVMMQLVQDSMAAFEADIINLFIGPLAEAKHIADADDEVFSQRLLNLKALINYGGSSDLDLANEYLQSLAVDKQQKDEKLEELFGVAFDFVNNDANWVAISQLAKYILTSNKNIIHCEEIASILDQSMARFHNRRAPVRYYH